VPRQTTIHGRTLEDTLFLAPGKIRTPRLSNYLESENAYTDDVMAPTKDCRRAFIRRCSAGIKSDRSQRAGAVSRITSITPEPKKANSTVSLPAQRQHQRPDEILLDLNQLAEGKTFLGLGTFNVSDDGNLLRNSTETTVTGSTQAAREGFADRPDLEGKRFERTGSISVGDRQQDAVLYHGRCRLEAIRQVHNRHIVGTDESELLYRRKGPAVSTWERTARSDKKMLFLTSVREDRHARRRYLAARTIPPATSRSCSPARTGHEYDIDHYNGLFYITTNRKAKNFRWSRRRCGSLGGKLEAVHRSQPGGEDRWPVLFRQSRCRLRA
jgi:oligopeptidase B